MTTELIWNAFADELEKVAGAGFLATPSAGKAARAALLGLGVGGAGLGAWHAGEMDAAGEPSRRGRAQHERQTRHALRMHRAYSDYIDEKDLDARREFDRLRDPSLGLIERGKSGLAGVWDQALARGGVRKNNEWLEAAISGNLGVRSTGPRDRLDTWPDRP